MPETDSKQSRFLHSLRRSRLLSDEEIDSFVAQHKLGDAEDGKIAREFLKSQILTTFQTRHILRGRWRGLTIDDYRILEPLSNGGMGEVYLARKKEVDESVAIKLLRSEFRDVKRNVERFRLEAFAIMTLRHPNILRGVEYDTIADARRKTHYLVTEFVQGPNLYELTVIRRGLPWQQASDVIMQAAEGLHFAHDNGFVHRDVKPGNLIISSSGTVKVLDFGLAQYSGPDEAFAFSRRKRRGTERYAAPEQTVTPYPIDRRADIYALGCTLFFALCGFPPSGDSAEIYPSSRLAIETLRESRSDLPNSLIRIVVRMLRRNPEKRYASALEVADALRPLAKRMPVEFNFHALLRAREKARKTQASWDTAEQQSGTTKSSMTSAGNSEQNSANTEEVQAESVEPSNRSSDFEAPVAMEPESNGEAIAKPLAAEKVADIFRRHRRQVDRLQARIETLETDLREQKETEADLRTQVNAKEAEYQQALQEHREHNDGQQLQFEKVCREQDDVKSELAQLKNDHRTLVDDLKQDIVSLTGQLEDSEKRHREQEKHHETLQSDRQNQIDVLSEQVETLEASNEQLQIAARRASEELVEKLAVQLQDFTEEKKNLELQMYSLQENFAAESAKQKKSAASADQLQAEVAELRQTVCGLEEKNIIADAAAAEEATARLAAEKALRDSKIHLNMVVRRAEMLSTEMNAFFRQLSEEQADIDFFDSYEEACEIEKDPAVNDSVIEGLVDDNILNELSDSPSEGFDET